MVVEWVKFVIIKEIMVMVSIVIVVDTTKFQKLE